MAKKGKKGSSAELEPADAAKGKKGKGGKGAKGDKGAGKGPKKSRVPRPVHSRVFAWVGLLALVPIALMLLQGTLTLEAAAQRSVLVLVVLMVIERVVAPLFLLVLQSEPEEKPVEAPVEEHEVA